MGTRGIRALIADDHAAYRRALMKFIDSQDDMQVVGAVADGRSVAALAWTVRPDVVVLDLFMPMTDGFAAAQQVKALDFAPAVIAVTAQRVEGVAMRCREAGVDVFLHKSWVEFDLLGAMRRLAKERAEAESAPHDIPAVSTPAVVWTADGGMPDRRSRVRVSVS